MTDKSHRWKWGSWLRSISENDEKALFNVGLANNATHAQRIADKHNHTVDQIIAESDSEVAALKARIEELEAAIAVLAPSTHEPDSPMARVRWANARIAAMKQLASEIAAIEGKRVAIIHLHIGRTSFEVSYHSHDDLTDAEFSKWAGENAVNMIKAVKMACSEPEDGS